VGADGGPAVWNTFNTWKFQEPVNLEEVTALYLLIWKKNASFSENSLKFKRFALEYFSAI